MGVPSFRFRLERNITIARLNIIVVVESLESKLIAAVVILADTFKHILMESSINIREGVTAQPLAHEVYADFLKQTVGRCEVTVAGIVGLLTFLLAGM